MPKVQIKKRYDKRGNLHVDIQEVKTTSEEIEENIAVILFFIFLVISAVFYGLNYIYEKFLSFF